MIIKVQLMPQMSVLDPIEKNVTIAMHVSLQEDDVELARTTSMATFALGQIQEVINFIGSDSDPIIAYLNAIWGK